MSSINNDAVEWHSNVAESFHDNYHNNNVFKQRFEIWKGLINNYSSSETVLLDVGCGSGVISFYASTKCKEVIGVDGSDEMIKLCKKKSDNIKNLKYEVENIEELNDEYISFFDMVLSSSVLEYVPDFDGALKKICSCLNPGGMLIISLPNKDSLYRRLLPIVYKLTRRPAYFKYIKNTLSLDDAITKLKNNNLEYVDSGFYSKTPLLSNLFHNTKKYKKYSENLFYVVAKKNDN